MLKTFFKHCDGMTMAVVSSLFGVSIFAITVIQNAFVDRLVEKDAQTLSVQAADHFNKNLLNQGALNSPDKRTSFPHPGFDSNHLIENVLGLQLQALTSHFNPRHMPVFHAERFEGASTLIDYLKPKFNKDTSLIELKNFAVYLPNGKVYLSENLFYLKNGRNFYLTSYPVISSVQNVFINGKSLYSLFETAGTNTSQISRESRHFIPMKRQGEVIAVVMFESKQTIAGMKMAGAVSDAVKLTAISGFPIVLLVVYLVWSRLTQEMKAERKINYISEHDELTDLPNRSYFYKMLDEQLKQANREKRELALLLIDIDNFHTINDIIGHKAADELLLTMVQRLLKAQPNSASLARLSGDEFVMILPGIWEAGEVAAFAGQIIHEVEMSLSVEGDEINVSSSIGIAFGCGGTHTPEMLIRNVKLALHLAKQEGGTFRFFEPEIDMALQKRRKLEMGLSQAMHHDQFEIYYQPQVELSSRRVMGYEALLRWWHPEFGLVSPGEFIPILEETKLIVEVGEYVLKRACEEAFDWPGQEKLAVNISSVQFELQNLPEMVERVLRETGFPPQRLEIEITESILMNDTERSIEYLKDLKALGVDIAMDDFGTGYSSLSYISKFVFDKIKIDQSFIAQIQTDERARAIINSVIGLGQSLNIRVTAEGIETYEQLLLIQSAGCHFGQGYLFGKPMPLDKIPEFKQFTLPSVQVA